MVDLGVQLLKHPRRMHAANHVDYEADEFPRKVASLIGRRVKAVYYYDNRYLIGYETDFWNRYGAAADFIYSVELTMDDGEILAIQSDERPDRFTGVSWLRLDVPDHYGLRGSNFSILETPEHLLQKYDVGNVWDVTIHSRWSSVTDVVLSGVDLYYGPAMVDGQPSSTECMYDLALHFANGHQVFIAGNCEGIFDGTTARCGGSLVVAFDESRAEALGIGPYAALSLKRYSGLAPTLSQGDHSPDLEPSLSDDGPDGSHPG